MTADQIKKILTLNFAFWLAAIGLPVLLRLLPTASGAPPKILEILVPLFQLLLAAGATWLVKTALGTTKRD